MIDRFPDPSASDVPLSRQILEAWDLARRSRANLMLIGPERLATRLIGEIGPDLLDPILVSRGSSFKPPAIRRARTIILRDVDTMAVDVQHQFHNWLEASGSTQVISTAAETFFRRVDTTFLESLYYKLNTIYVEVGWLPRAVRPAIGKTVSIDRAAELLRVSRRTIYNRIKQGRLQTVRTLGGSQRITVESIAQLQKELAPPTIFTRIASGT